MRSQLIFLYFILICSAVNSRQIPLKFSHLTVDNGLSHTDTKDIKQDKLGFIWIATLFGVDRFDGYTIKSFYNNIDKKNNAFRNRIRSVYPDENGNIWLVTDAGIQCFDSKKEQYERIEDQTHESESLGYTSIIKLKNEQLFTLRLNKPCLYRLYQNQIMKIPLKVPDQENFYDAVSDSSGNVWLTSESSIWLLNKRNEIKKTLSLDVQAVSGYHLSKIYFNKQGDLILINGRQIILTDWNLNQKNLFSGEVARITIAKQKKTIAESSISDIVQDHYNNYWVSTDKGLLLLSSDLQLMHTITSKSVPNGLNTNHLGKLLIDRSECLWICSFGGGVSYSDLNMKLFYTIQHNPDLVNTLSGNHIRAVLEENGNKLWIGTNENGLNCYNYITKKFTLLNTVSKPVALKSEVINSLVFDKNGSLWIGTDKGIQILSKDRLHLLHPGGYENFPDYNIESLAIDYYGNIWFGSVENKMGLILRQNSGKYIVQFFDSGHSIYADPDKPQVFVSSTHGIIHMFLNPNGTVSKMLHYQVNNSRSSLSSNYIWPIQKVTDKKLWVGTLGGGLNLIDLKPDGGYEAKSFASKHNIFNDVESLQTDNQGNVWMGGKGLEKFDPVSEKVIKYDNNDGLQGNSFKVGASYKGQSGRLYFGGINGLNYFYPDSIRLNTIPAHPVFTDMIINNKKVNVGKSSSKENPLQKAISYGGVITLNYLQNNFVISFSSMHFANPLKCRYRYKLIGFDKDWNYTNGNNASAAYSNLDYNSYTLALEATNNDGIWSTDKASISIVINPPWRKSIIAKISYALLFLTGLIYVYVYQGRWYRLKREIALREVEERKREEIHQQREELYQQQLQFFTNISHEFRTPLTLILGPLETLIKENTLSVFNHSYQIMYRNAKRLINLINELMNFRKVADSAIKLQVRQVKLNQFITDLAEEFKDLAARKEIVFSLIKTDDVLFNWFDVQIVEKILFNLLNNSFKYTSAGGRVTLEVFFNLDQYKPVYAAEFCLLNEYRAEQYVYFRVADTGIGISKESISQIFDRYYRVSYDHLGSGVGLALVKSLAVLHKGDIYVYSERYKGTDIIIGLPWGEKNYSTREKDFANINQAEAQLEKIDNTVLFSPSGNEVNQNEDYNVTVTCPHILLVEDNDELRSFLKGVLQRHYHVFEAADGSQGLDLAVDKVPDLIISDVMMPVMNGVELCRQLKEKFETSHIPFIILSAKDALEAKLEGMESGADFYFSKPLSVELLLLTIHNLFEQKQKLKNKYTRDYYADATELVHSAKDKKFMDDLLELIEANIQLPELDVDYLCQHLCTSRTKLYQKINSISGQSVGEFIRTIRLKKAVHIMTHEDISLNEVAERIGLQSSSYFSRAFKKEFGQTPSQFLRTLKKNQE